MALLLVASLLGVVACSGGDETPATTSTTSTTPPSTPTTVAATLEQGEQISVYVPEVGDCFDRRTLEEVEETIILLLDCDLPHEAEVFHVFEVTDADLAAAESATSATTATTVAADDGAVGGEDDPSSTSTAGSSDGGSSDGGATGGSSGDGDAGEDVDEDETPTTVVRSMDATLEDIARRRCPQFLGAFVGMPYERSELEVSWWLPSPDDWDEGRRMIACTLFDPTTERLAGSQRDARR